MISDIHKFLIDNKKTISTCESITAGAISSRLITEPGSSGFFKGSIVVYNVDVKSKIDFHDICHCFMEDQKCSVCDDNGRDDKTLCIIKDPTDIFIIDKA